MTLCLNLPLCLAEIYIFSPMPAHLLRYIVLKFRTPKNKEHPKLIFSPLHWSKREVTNFAKGGNFCKNFHHRIFGIFIFEIKSLLYKFLEHLLYWQFVKHRRQTWCFCPFNNISVSIKQKIYNNLEMEHNLLKFPDVKMPRFRRRNNTQSGRVLLLLGQRSRSLRVLWSEECIYWIEMQ